MFRRCWLNLLLGVIITIAAGCASEEYDRDNALWRQGYGFNNPNAARIRQGKAPLDF